MFHSLCISILYSNTQISNHTWSNVAHKTYSRSLNNIFTILHRNIFSNHEFANMYLVMALWALESEIIPGENVFRKEGIADDLWICKDKGMAPVGQRRSRYRLPRLLSGAGVAKTGKIFKWTGKEFIVAEGPKFSIISNPKCGEKKNRVYMVIFIHLLVHSCILNIGNSRSWILRPLRVDRFTRRQNTHRKLYIILLNTFCAPPGFTEVQARVSIRFNIT